MIWTESRPLRVVELFAGIGAQAQALENLGIPFKSTVCEIDKFAYDSYCAIHGPTENLGDITKVKNLSDCDLLTYSFPCQDLSTAGNMRGMSENSGTRSALLWEVGRLLKTMKKNGNLPDYLLMENVPAVLFAGNIREFRRWIQLLSELGYCSSYSILNAKRFGIPQNRRRCFMISTKNNKKFIFPRGNPLKCKLTDFLEKNVPEKYYIPEKKISKYRVTEKNVHYLKYPADSNIGYMRAHSRDGVVLNRPQLARGTVQTQTSPTLTCGAGCGTGVVVAGSDIQKSDNGYLKYPLATSLRYSRAYVGDGVDLRHLSTKDKTGVQKQSCSALRTKFGCGSGTVTPDLRIRALSPRECWRLMGFSDRALDAAVGLGLSDSRLYILAGNSIVVNVLEAIFRGMFIENSWATLSVLEKWI